MTHITYKYTSFPEEVNNKNLKKQAFLVETYKIVLLYNENDSKLCTFNFSNYADMYEKYRKIVATMVFL